MIHLLNISFLSVSTATSNVRTNALRGILAIVLFGLISSNISAAQIYFGHEPLNDAVATITFSEVDLGTVNPTFSFEGISRFGDLTVSFGSIFVGQVLGPMDNSLLVSQPDAQLMLDDEGPDVATLLDLKSSSPPVLGGSHEDRFFATPLAMLFDRPVNAVSFELGSLDGPATTFVEVFDQQGNTLGITQNISSGFETISARSSAINISRVSIYVREGLEDWEGFGLNDVAVAAIPEPTAHVIFLMLFACTAGMWRRMI